MVTVGELRGEWDRRRLRMEELMDEIRKDGIIVKVKELRVERNGKKLTVGELRGEWDKRRLRMGELMDETRKGWKKCKSTRTKG